MSKKKWSSFFMGVFAMSLLAGCSGDELADGGRYRSRKGL